HRHLINFMSMLKQSYFYLNKIKSYALVKKWSLLIISILFIASGAINNGMNWFLPALPFFVIFTFQLRKLTEKEAFVVRWFVLIICIIFGWNHPKNKLLYPCVGAEIIILQEFGQPISMKIVKVIGNPNLFTPFDGFTAVFENGDVRGICDRMGEDELFENLAKGKIISSDLQGVKTLQSKWSEYLGNLMYWPMVFFWLLAWLGNNL
ncbi:MAG: hypothetical protein K1X66_09690, partial [Verrucomicrobiae bacterium]|nr:hypothetical protein [Verrucomicrobiae bacterium]